MLLHSEAVRSVKTFHVRAPMSRHGGVVPLRQVARRGFDFDIGTDGHRSATHGAFDLAIGIDLGGTNIAAGVVDRKGKLLGRAKKKTKAVEGRDSVLSRLVTAMEDACTEAGVSLADGLAARGVGRTPNGGLVHPNLSLNKSIPQN